MAVNVKTKEGFPIDAKISGEVSETIRFGQTILANGSPFEISSIGILFDIPVDSFGSVHVHLDGTYTGQAIAFEQTIDGSTWFPSHAFEPGSTLPLIPGGKSLSGTFQEFPLSGAMRFRARVAALASGSIIANVSLMADKSITRSSYNVSVGGASDGASIVGNPVRVGARAISSIPSILSNGQAADLITTLDRRLVINPYSLSENIKSASVSITNSTVAVTLQPAQSANIKNYITSLQISSGVLSAATQIVIRSGANGTVLARYDIPATGLPLTPIHLPVPLQSGSATLLEVATTAAVTGTININAQGFIAS